jgi:hypothetical protein
VRECFTDIDTAAAAYGLLPKTLAGRLHFVRWRRLYGWAFWDGHCWNLPIAAFDPVARGDFLARQPADEPAAHVRMLPSWCEKVDGAGVNGSHEALLDGPSPIERS